MEIPASPNFLSKCFACVAVKCTSANQQLLLWLLNVGKPFNLM